MNVTSAGWQVTLCDPIIWHVSSRYIAVRHVAILHANCYSGYYIHLYSPNVNWKHVNCGQGRL